MTCEDRDTTGFGGVAEAGGVADENETHQVAQGRLVDREIQN